MALVYIRRDEAAHDGLGARRTSLRAFSERGEPCVAILAAGDAGALDHVIDVALPLVLADEQHWLDAIGTEKPEVERSTGKFADLHGAKA